MSDTDKENQIENILADTPESVTSKMPVTWQLSILFIFLLLIFSAGTTTYILSNKTTEIKDQTATAIETDRQVPTEGNINTFANLKIGAKSALVFDIKTGEVLYEHNADAKWPLASITKLMTALVAREIVPIESEIPITTEAIAQDGESGLKVGESFSYEKLSDLVLLTSSNDGAFALANYAGTLLDQDQPATTFVKAMNIRAKEIGLNDTYFRNPTGLDLTELESGAYSSASDVAKLMSYIVINYPEILEETTKSSNVVYNESGESHTAANTNVVVNSIPSLIGSKTGYTELSGGNLVVAFDAGINRPIVVAVLGSTYYGRFNDVLQLVEATRNSFQN